MTAAAHPDAQPGRPRPVAAWVAAAILGLVLTVVVFGSWVPGYDPLRQSLANRNAGFLAVGRDGVRHLFGTDMLGRDLLSRVVQGGRISLTIAAAATVLSAALGCTLGIVAGYLGGLADTAISALTDLLFSVPRLLFIVAALAVFPATVTGLVLLLTLTSWAVYARVARVNTLALRSRDFVLCAPLMGASAFSTLRRHVLPHVVGDLVILASFEVGTTIMLEASLSYLGLGVRPPAASWGLMINQAQSYLGANAKLVVLPGALIFAVVGSVNILSRSVTAEARAWNV